MSEADAVSAFDGFLAELRNTVVPNLARFPRIGRRYLENPPQSVEALTQLSVLPAGAVDSLRQYLHGDYLFSYAAIESNETVYLLSIPHHRQLTFDFPAHWPR